MVDRGKILEEIVRKKAPNISRLAHEMGIDRVTIYRHFKDPDLDDSVILDYAKALKYSFSLEFPDLPQYINQLNEPIGEYKPITVAEALKEADYWKTKYIDLLEKHNGLLNNMLAGGR